MGFIRSERGDTLVYCRVYDIDEPYYLFNDFLLYDFSKSFEYGDTIRFGHVGFIKEELIDEEDGTLDYYYNVLEDGDTLPSWNGLVYKLGYLEGPFGLFFSELSAKYPPDPDSATGSVVLLRHPKPQNVSHTLFSTKTSTMARNTWFYKISHPIYQSILHKRLIQRFIHLKFSLSYIYICFTNIANYK